MTTGEKVGLSILAVPVVFLWIAFSAIYLQHGFRGIQGEGVVTNSEKTSQGSKTGCRSSVKVTKPADNGGVISGFGCYEVGSIVPVVVTSDRHEMGVVGHKGIILLKGIAIVLSLPIVVIGFWLGTRRF